MCVNYVVCETDWVVRDQHVLPSGAQVHLAQLERRVRDVQRELPAAQICAAAATPPAAGQRRKGNDTHKVVEEGKGGEDESLAFEKCTSKRFISSRGRRVNVDWGVKEAPGRISCSPGRKMWSCGWKKVDNPWEIHLVRLQKKKNKRKEKTEKRVLHRIVLLLEVTRRHRTCEQWDSGKNPHSCWYNEMCEQYRSAGRASWLPACV